MKRPLRNARSAFTLIELLAVMLIIGVLAASLLPQIPRALDRTNVTACRANLKNVGEGLLLYQQQFKHMPKESGALFHTSLIYDKVWESTEQNAKRLTCPAIDTNSLVGIAGFPAEEWYVEQGSIDGSSTAYAGRDMRENPIRKYPISGKEVLVGDDNDPDGNHRTTTLALMGDFSVKEFELVVLQKDGLVGEEEEFLLVGPGSPVEALEKLSID